MTADGKKDRLYCIYHGNRVIGFLYQNRMRCLTKMPDFVQAYGILPEYQGLGLGSAVLYRALTDLRTRRYVIADIDGQHPGSLACFRRAASVLNWRMGAIGRFNADKKKFEFNRRPRVEEGTGWCLRTAGAPELFPGRLPRGQWPRTANEEDVSASMLPEEYAGEEGVETEVQEEEEVVAPPQPKRSRGRQPKSAQFRRRPRRQKRRRSRVGGNGVDVRGGKAGR